MPISYSLTIQHAGEPQASLELGNVQTQAPHKPQVLRNQLQDAIERFRELARSVPSELQPVAMDLECRLMEIRNRIR